MKKVLVTIPLLLVMLCSCQPAEKTSSLFSSSSEPIVSTSSEIDIRYTISEEVWDDFKKLECKSGSLSQCVFSLEGNTYIYYDIDKQKSHMYTENHPNAEVYSIGDITYFKDNDDNWKKGSKTGYSPLYFIDSLRSIIEEVEFSSLQYKVAENIYVYTSDHTTLNIMFHNDILYTLSWIETSIHESGEFLRIYDVNKTVVEFDPPI